MTCTYCGRWFTKDTCPGCGAPRMEPPYRALTDIPASFATTHCSALRNVAADYPADRELWR